MKTKWLPALIMLLAGAINCVLAFAKRLSPLAFTVRLLLVLIIFYVLGTLVQWIVDANFKEMEEQPGEEEGTSGEGDADAELEEGDAQSETETEEELENIDAGDA